MAIAVEFDAPQSRSPKPAFPTDGQPPKLPSQVPPAGTGGEP